MTDTVSFTAPQGTITITKTGTTTATLNEFGTVYDCVDVKVVGNVISCQVTGQPFVTPQVSITLKSDDVVITISKSWVADGTTDYPVPDDQFKELEAFAKLF